MPPPQKKVFDFGSENVDLVHFGRYFAVQLPAVHARNTAFGFRKLAAACKQTAKGKSSLLETIRGTIVLFYVY